MRAVKCLYILRFLAHRFKKPFDQATKNDLLELVADIENDSHYANSTKYDFKIMLKLLYRWLKGNDETTPPEVSWLKPKLKNDAHKLPEQLLSEAEVLKIVESADNPRDRALILVLYETGCRIGELMSIRMKNIGFDEYGAVLRVTGKTGDRRVRVISSAPALTTWIQHYPNRENPEAPLWPPNSSNYKYKESPSAYGSVYTLIRTLASKAGIRKKVHPHLFRHSRATALAGKLTEAQMKEYFGWVQGSDMAATYVHLSGRDVDKALLELHGIKQSENKQEDQIKLKYCQRCKEKNSPVAKFCIKCGTPIELELINQIEQERQAGDNVLNQLMKNEEFKEFMAKKVIELGLDKQIA